MEIKIDGIIRPPHPKQPTKPPPSPVSPIPTHTQSYTESPPTNTIIPPSPSHQTPLNHHFTTPPPLKNTTTPTPPTAAPVAYSSPTHDDYPTHMDLEENPGEIPIFPERIGQLQDFESQLRDIDNAINYSPPSMESFPKTIPSSKSTLNSPQQTPRVALGDVTNKAMAQLGDHQLC